MASSRDGTITEDLARWSRGDAEASARVVASIYQELRRIALSYSRGERPDHTLQATALVHETYLRLYGDERIEWQSRAHFLGIAARIMRRLLIDHARRRHAHRRGGSMRRVALTQLDSIGVVPASEILELEDALVDLAKLDPRQASIVEARFFGGMNVEETAEFVGVSRATVIREWRRARAWLYGQLRSESGDGD